MKVLVVIKNSPAHSYLFTVKDKATADEVNGHVRKGSRSRAINTIIRKGSFEREVEKSDISAIKAHLILSDYSARWDLTK